MCEVALEFITQKWISFKPDSSLKTFKLDIPLPINLYKLITITEDDPIKNTSTTTTANNFVAKTNSTTPS